MPKFALPLLIALCALAPAAATAHSYAPISDAALARNAAAIVQGRVISSAPVLDSDGAYTEYRVAVDVRIKGVVGGTVTVRTIGGPLADGTVLIASGSPALTVGERVILFLEPDRGDGHRVAQGRLGAFHVLDTNGRDVASRSLSRGAALQSLPDGTRWLGPRDADRFVAWLRATTLPRPAPPADYFLASEIEAVATLPFSLLQAGGRAARWVDLDQEFRTTGALPGVEGGGIAESLAAAAAWSENSGLNLTVLAGGGSATAETQDGINSIIFQDPDNQIGGSFDCNGGGTLGETRARILLEPQEVDGETFFTLIEADVVLQDGIECWFERTLEGPEELIGHELGHAAGIDHSEILDALMFASAHGDGRGAAIHEDDVAALRALKYGEASSGDPGDDALPRLGKPRALQPRGGNNDLPLVLRFRTRDTGVPTEGPIQLYELEIFERGAAEPLIVRTLRFGRDLDETCSGARSSCDVLLDQRAVTSKFEPGGRYVWRIRASQGAGDVENNFSPWSNRRKFRLRR